jgi:segregation and condensation protein A
MVTHDYTVRLEQMFQGPLDLLLHLVKEQEVDIHEIEISRVVDGYLAYIKDLREIDIELAADFLLMAATLMSIKSRSLLPREEIDLEAEHDPRDELIQRLIEYRHFKTASRDLGERFDARSRIFAHGWHPPTAEEPTLDLSELSHWDLLSAFSRLMRETLAHRPMVIKADTHPLRYWVERMVHSIRSSRQMTLRSLVEQSIADEGASKPVLIGTFCALLELMKLGLVTAWQKSATDDITITLRDDVDSDVDSIVRLTEFEDERAADESAVAAPSPAVATDDAAVTAVSSELEIESDAIDAGHADPVT